MNVISLVAAALALTVSTPALAQHWYELEWREYESQIDAFGVSFPGEPTIEEITYTTEYYMTLPGRVYSTEIGPNRYSVTVVDYRNLEELEAERVRECRASGGDGDLCQNHYLHDMRGAIIFATWNILKRGGELTYLAYSRTDLVEGHEFYVTNDDGSRTIAAIYMHEDLLYILEATVPGDAPAPTLFYKSMGFLDENGERIRYRTPYANGLTEPERNR
jgi:hypothetical protein